MVHLGSGRASRGTDGVDFYGRPTDAVWFNVPRFARLRIVTLLMLNSILQFLHQSFHFVYYTYATITTMPGLVLLALTMITSAGCGLLAGARSK